jgi:hypothetical protein
MDTRKILELVKKSFHENWEPVKLAKILTEEQKEDDALLLESEGYPELAEKIRNS